MELTKVQNKQVNVLAQDLEQVASSYVFSNGVGEVSLIADDQYVACAEDLKMLKAKQKEIKGLRDSFVEGAKKTIENVDAVFKPQLKLIAALEKELKKALAQYVDDIRTIASERMEKAVAVNDREALVKATELEHPQVSGIVVRNSQTVHIINREEIPRRYLKVDEAAIKKAAKAGIRIPGVEVYESTSIAAGSK